MWTSLTQWQKWLMQIVILTPLTTLTTWFSWLEAKNHYNKCVEFGMFTFQSSVRLCLRSIWNAKRKGFFCVRHNFLIAYKVMIFWVLNPFKCLKRILVGIAIRCERKKSGYYSQNLHKIAFRTMRWSAPSSYYCSRNLMWPESMGLGSIAMQYFFFFSKERT